MKNDAKFTTLRTLATDLAQSLLSAEDFAMLTSRDFFYTYCSIAKIKVCKHCEGAGLRRARFICHKCGGKGHTETVLPEVDEIEKTVLAKQNAFSKRLVKLAEKAKEKLRLQAEVVEKAEQVREERRTESLAFLDDKQRKQFNLAITEGTGSFIESIKTQWKLYGKLSVNQVNAILSSYKSACRQELESSLYNDYTNGQTVSVKVKIVSIRNEQVNNGFGFGAGEITKVSMKAHSQQQFSIGTGSQKLIDKMIKLQETGTWFTLTGLLKWQSDNRKYLSLSAKGLKIDV